MFKKRHRVFVDFHEWGIPVACFYSQTIGASLAWIDYKNKTANTLTCDLFASVHSTICFKTFMLVKLPNSISIV